MIIDADCHISPTFEGGNSITIDELLRRMDNAGVDKALTWLAAALRARGRPGESPMSTRPTRKYPDRILGFGWADPNLGVEQAKDDGPPVHRGVRLPRRQAERRPERAIAIDDPQTAPARWLKRSPSPARHWRFTSGRTPIERTHPFRAAKSRPHVSADLPILMVHMGGASFTRPEQRRNRDRPGLPQHAPDRQRRARHRRS